MDAGERENSSFLRHFYLRIIEKAFHHKNSIMHQPKGSRSWGKNGAIFFVIFSHFASAQLENKYSQYITQSYEIFRP